MIRISVRTDYQRLNRRLSDFERRHLPFAAARALTATAKAAKGEVEQAVSSTFDRPTPFTQRGVGITPATKVTLRAVVFVKDQQASYLGLQERGGIRKPKKRALVNPAGVKLNQYGNIPAKALARLKKQKDVFIGTVKGIGGVWQRPERGLRHDGTHGTKGNTTARLAGKRTGLNLLMRFDDPVRVERRPFFDPAIDRVARREFGRRLREALDQALQNSR